MIKSTLAELKVWASLHIFIGIGVPVILLFFFGCKELKEEQAPLGIEYSQEKVKQAEEAPLAGQTIYNVHFNEQVVIEKTQEIEGGPAQPLLYTKFEVFSLNDSCNFFEFKYNVITEDPNADEGTKPIKTEKDSGKFEPRPEKVNSDSCRGASLSSLSLIPSEDFIANSSFYEIFQNSVPIFLTNEQEPVRESYHDLSVTQEIQSPPLLVRERENCSGIPNCQLKVTKVQYDYVLWYPDQSFQKIQIVREFSTDAPVFGSEISFCFSTLVPHENRTVFIRQCDRVVDFWPGSEHSE